MGKSNRHLGIVNQDKDLDLSWLEKRDKNKVSLRIDDNTVILVDKKNATKKYAERYKQLINNNGYR